MLSLLKKSRFFVLLVMLSLAEVTPVEGQCTAKNCRADDEVDQPTYRVTDGNVQHFHQLDQRLRILEQQWNQNFQKLDGRSSDCTEIAGTGQRQSGWYKISIVDGIKNIDIAVFCEFSTSGENWLIFQRRQDGSVDFYRTWDEYAKGFGDMNGEFWLGNEILHLLTLKRKYKLRIELEDFDGNTRYAEYSRFSVNSSADYYRLSVDGYSGNADDGMSTHNGQQFTTKDADHDLSEFQCSLIFRGGWWYNKCHRSNLNGLYLRGSYSTPNVYGMEWSPWRYFYSLKKSSMKISTIT